jgi:dihydroorotate dehydrogenase electron transfer subunit
MIIEEAQVISNTALTDGYFVLTIESPLIAKVAKPGQFINVRTSNELDPLLPRPISIYDAGKEKGTLKILYFTKGKGTNLLAGKITGDKLQITGPQGNYFSSNKQNILLVGGGFGTAPLSFFAKENKDKHIFVAIGGRTKDLIFCEDDFKKNGARVLISTYDGSEGKKGLVTEVVKEILDKEHIEEIFTVGPIPMMKAVSEIAKSKNIPVYVSMEERMACGIGVCFGCVCKTKSGNKTVCTDGPIFKASEVFDESRS